MGPEAKPVPTHFTGILVTLKDAYGICAGYMGPKDKRPYKGPMC